MTKYFKTIKEEAHAEVIEKKSKFIANVAPVESEKEALEFINKIKKKHYKASHNCYAFIAGGTLRFSDDGEPSGTAGKPMFEYLQKEKLENVVVVVTRYFGGIELGTGGLVRAYGRTAKEGILAGKIIEMDMYSKINICINYSLSAKILYEIENFEINNNKAILVNTEYGENVIYEIYVKLDLVEEYIGHIKDLVNNNIVVEKKEDEFLKLIDNKISL